MNKSSDALDNQAAYWNGAVTRKEFQAVQDDNAVLLKYLADVILGADGVPGLAVAMVGNQLLFQFILEKLGVTPEDLAAWQAAKKAELSAATPAGEPKPQVVN